MATCLVYLVSGIPIYLALMAAHEFGHLLAGLSMGLPFVRFTVGPVVVVREEGRIRARLNTAWLQPAAWIMHTPVWSADAAWKWGIFVLGGPASNLLLGVALLWVAQWVNPGPPDSTSMSWRQEWPGVALIRPGDLTTALLNASGIASLYLTFASLIPRRIRNWRSDGGQLLDLWRLRSAGQAIGCPASAMLFISAALGELCASRRRERGRDARHVSARDFCDYLITFRGDDTPSILRAYNLRCSEDVGRIVFGLVNAGLLGRSESDAEEDFRGLFVLE
jgi:uncharacterized repeat protein (TIGR04138 family)